jgi:hypothetical protein
MMTKDDFDRSFATIIKNIVEGKKIMEEWAGTIAAFVERIEIDEVNEQTKKRIDDIKSSMTFLIDDNIKLIKFDLDTQADIISRDKDDIIQDYVKKIDYLKKAGKEPSLDKIKNADLTRIYQNMHDIGEDAARLSQRFTSKTQELRTPDGSPLDDYLFMKAGEKYLLFMKTIENMLKAIDPKNPVWNALLTDIERIRTQ